MQLATGAKQRSCWDSNGAGITPRSEEEFEEFVNSIPPAPEVTQSSSTVYRKGPLWPGVTRLPLSASSASCASPQHRVQECRFVELNVGGEIFPSSASTLRRAPFFDSLLQQAEDGVAVSSSWTIDEAGRYFIDRSGDLFKYILDYLRTSQWPVHDRMQDQAFVDMLRDEAIFYGLDSQDQLPPLCIPEYVTIWQFRDDTALYVDCLEQTLREDPDHQGSFRLCKYFGGLPLDAKTNTKRFKASTHGVQSVLAYFASRGWSLKHVVEGSMVTHTTSAEAQARMGHSVQYILVRYGFMRGPSAGGVDIPFMPDTQRTWQPDAGEGVFESNAVWAPQSVR